MSLGFFVNMERCIGCRTCQVACKDRHGIQLAGTRPRRVDTFETGSFPSADLFHRVISCNHCDNPACVAACPTAAMHVADDGVVLHDDSRCVLCRSCMMACPYGAPQYDVQTDMIVKCDSCKPLRNAGMNPTCVDACVQRALEFGDIEQLRAAHPGAQLVSEIPCIGSAEHTRPNLLLLPTEGAKAETFTEVYL